jgi:hypothetical protein
MVGVLIQMRGAILRRRNAGKRAIGGLALLLFATLLALGTLETGFVHYHYRGACANVVATLSFGSLIAYGAQFDGAAALVGALAVLLDLVLAVVASTAAIAVFGPNVSSRRGRDFGELGLRLRASRSCRPPRSAR